MDPLDLALARTFGLPLDGVRRTPTDLRPARLAARTGTTAPTVRDRLDRFRRAGFLLGFAVVPNPALGGERVFAACYPVGEPDRSAALRRLVDEGQVMNVISFTGSGVVVISTARDELHARERKAGHEKILGVGATWHAESTTLRTDPPPMTPLDWRVWEAVRADAMRPLDEVAREVRVTRRTVKTRYDRLLREGCAYLLPALDWTRFPGAMHHWLLLAVEPGTKERVQATIHGLLGDRSLGTEIPATDAEHVLVAMWSRTPGEAEEVRLLASAIGGVRLAEVHVPAAVR